MFSCRCYSSNYKPGWRRIEEDSGDRRQGVCNQAIDPASEGGRSSYLHGCVPRECDRAREARKVGLNNPLIQTMSDIIGNSVEDIKGSVAKMILKLEDERFSDEQLDIKLSECPSEGLHTAKPDTDDEVPEDDTEEAKPPLTAEQKFLQLVISHCRHFISLSGQPSWQLSSLSTVSCCLDLLGSTPHQSPGQAQETLLPLVHQTWHPLRLLFKSTNIFIVDKAFECLMVIAKHARDFVHKRTVTDVFPPLLKFFQTLQLMVSDRDKHTTLAASQSRRILARLSAGVWDLLELLDLQPLETDPIIQLLLEHLGDKLDVAGEENSSHCILEPKRNLDANILWLKLNHKSS